MKADNDVSKTKKILNHAVRYGLRNVIKWPFRETVVHMKGRMKNVSSK